MEDQPASRNIAKKRNNSKIDLDVVGADIISRKLKAQPPSLQDKSAFSTIWNTLLQIVNENGEPFREAVWCPICQTALIYNTRNGTSSLRYHANKF